MRFRSSMTVRRQCLFSALAAIALASAVPAAWAHETACPHCKLGVVQDTPEQDNEVALRYGRKRIEYRCVLCALSQAKTEFRGDLTILAPSEVKGKPVVIARTAGKWSVTPENALFIAQKLDHSTCHLGYRAFSSRAGFDTHVKRFPRLLDNARPMTLAEVLNIVR